MDETLTPLEHLPIQYADAAGYITQEPDDAASAAVFTADSEVIVSMVRLRSGKWRADSSDHWRLSSREERARFRSPVELLDTLSAARHLSLTEITQY